MLAFAPWQVLLLVSVPIAALSIIGVRFGIAADDDADLHRDPVDVIGAVLGTVTIVLVLVAPTLFVNEGAGSWVPWAMTGAAAPGRAAFVLRERSARYPLLDLKLVARPLVSSGLAFKAAAGLATAGLGYLVTLQTAKLDWGWPPARAAIGMLPQVIVLLALGPLVNPFVQRVGIERAAWFSAAAVVFGLAVYSLFSRLGYCGSRSRWCSSPQECVSSVWSPGSTCFVVCRRTGPRSARHSWTPQQRSLRHGHRGYRNHPRGMFTGNIAAANWSRNRPPNSGEAVTIAGLALTVVAAALLAGDRPDAAHAERPGSHVP